MSLRRVSRPVQLGLSILLGYIPLAIAFGAGGRLAGVGFVGLVAMSVFVFAGASQFLAVQLLVTGVGGPGIILATLSLNLRHLVMSFALRGRLSRSGVPRPILAFGVTDEVFAAAATAPGAIRDRDLVTMEILAYAGWVGGTIIGFLLGGVLPAAVQEAMAIALYALFVALLVPGIRRFWRYGLAVAAAGGLHALLGLLPLDRGLILPVAIVVPALGLALIPGFHPPDRENE